MGLSDGMTFAVVGLVAVFSTIGILMYFMIQTYFHATRELEELRARQQEQGVQLQNLRNQGNQTSQKEWNNYPSFLVENPYEQYSVAIRTESCEDARPNELK